MKKTIIYLLFAGILMAGPSWAEEDHQNRFKSELEQRRSAHREQQKQENQSFRQSLKDLDPAARSAAIKSHRTQQYQENQAFSATNHQERMTHVRQRLAQSPNLSEAQKAEILSRLEGKYQEHVKFHEQQHQENLAFMQTLQDMDPQARRQAMKDHRETQKSGRKAFREQMKSERRAFRQSMRSGGSGQSAQ